MLLKISPTTMKLTEILPQGWQNPRIWPSATHIFVAHNHIWATDGPPEWYPKTPGWTPTTYSQPIEHIPVDMPEEARSVVWVRAKAKDGAILNEFGHDLREYLPDGWDNSGAKATHRFIAIDANGDVIGYLNRPDSEGCDDEWIYLDSNWSFIYSTGQKQLHWRELIWQRPTPQQC